jgi:hypothetical protein
MATATSGSRIYRRDADHRTQRRTAGQAQRNRTEPRPIQPAKAPSNRTFQNTRSSCRMSLTAAYTLRGAKSGC